MTKIYQAKTRLTLSVTVEGKPVYVTFSEEKNTYCTANPKIQAALEATGEFGKRFKLKSVSGTLEKEIAGETGVDEPAGGKDDKDSKGLKDGDEGVGIGEAAGAGAAPAEASSGETKTHPEVTDFQAAKEVLRKIYGVHQFSMSTPGNILKKTEELGVSFPNLK
jgi:hypothetical protein